MTSSVPRHFCFMASHSGWGTPVHIFPGCQVASVEWGILQGSFDDQGGSVLGLLLVLN